MQATQRLYNEAKPIYCRLWLFLEPGNTLVFETLRQATIIYAR